MSRTTLLLTGRFSVCCPRPNQPSVDNVSRLLASTKRVLVRPAHTSEHANAFHSYSAHAALSDTASLDNLAIRSSVSTSSARPVVLSMRFSSSVVGIEDRFSRIQANRRSVDAMFRGNMNCCPLFIADLVQSDRLLDPIAFGTFSQSPG